VLDGTPRILPASFRNAVPLILNYPAQGSPYRHIPRIAA
jgi:hypothetical protein